MHNRHSSASQQIQYIGALFFSPWINESAEQDPFVTSTNDVWKKIIDIVGRACGGYGQSMAHSRSIPEAD